jgi:hypothetical protein
MYTVKAFERGCVVCAIGAGLGIRGAVDAVLFARSLRDEFPGAIVAIFPFPEAG